MRFAILGVGGVGGLIGGLLARQGDDVTLVATAETTTLLNDGGLSVRSARFGNFAVRAAAVSELTSPVDVCVVAVKAHQLAAAVARVPAGTVAEGLVVPFLNGIEHVENLRAIFDGAVVPATIRVEATRIAPGQVEHTSPFTKVELALPPNDDPGKEDKVRTLARHLEAAGADVQLRHSEGSMLWGKLIFLVPLALLTTYYEADAGEVRTAHRTEMCAVIQEVGTVAAKSGAEVSVDDAIKFFDSVPATMQSSMQRDVTAGRVTEIDAIGGAVVRKAAGVSVPVPTTERLVRALERS